MSEPHQLPSFFGGTASPVVGFLICSGVEGFRGAKFIPRNGAKGIQPTIGPKSPYLPNLSWLVQNLHQHGKEIG